MEEKLDLTQILKNAPAGTKLYSPIFGELMLMGINMCSRHAIETKDSHDTYRTFDKEGKYFTTYDNAECVLFPSKDNRYWSTFNIIPKFDINTLQPFDKVLCRYNNRNNWVCDFYEYYDKNSKEFCCIVEIYNQCVPYNDETKHLLCTTEMPPEKYINW